MEIGEPDWKLLRALHGVALERYCEQVLQECAAILGDSRRTAHERYLELFELMRKRDAALARIFNDLRRSTAKVHLLAMVGAGLVSGHELTEFSPPMRDLVESMLQLRRR
jgi:hypothetical protein